MTLESFGILESRYELGDRNNGYHNKGAFTDAMHPQARYTLIQRLNDTALRVVGSRPRALNIGIKRFDISLIPSKALIEGSTDEVNRKFIDNLQQYFLNR